MSLEALIVAFVAGVFTGGALGLWRGEREASRIFQNMLTNGHPAGAAVAKASIDQLTPEARAHAATFSEATITRGVNDIMQQAREAGQPIGPEEARELVIQMLSPDTTPEMML